jgi:hypothetical protein
MIARSLTPAGTTDRTTDPVTGMRFYRWQGRALPSVTTVLHALGVPRALHDWAVDQVVDAALIRIYLAAVLDQDELDPDLLRASLRAAATRARDEAAALGTAVHDAIASGVAVDRAPALVRRHLLRYYEWAAVYGAETVASEFQVWNLGAGYAGTADLLSRMPDGTLWLIDIKTGRFQPDHALQVIAYAKAEFVGRGDTVDERLTGLLSRIHGTAILHLTESSWEFIPVVHDGGTWAAFLGLLAAVTWRLAVTSTRAAQPQPDGASRRLVIGERR